MKPFEGVRARLRKRDALRAGITFRLGMKDVGVCRDNETESGIGGTDAVVVLLPVAFREIVFVEETDPVDALARQAETEPVNKRNLGQYVGRRPLLAIAIQIFGRQSPRQVVNCGLVFGTPMLRNGLMAGRT